MKNLLTLILISFLSISIASAATYTTVQSGLWSDADTWFGGSIPSGNNNDIITINDNHIVTGGDLIFGTQLTLTIKPNATLSITSIDIWTKLTLTVEETGTFNITNVFDAWKNAVIAITGEVTAGEFTIAGGGTASVEINDPGQLTADPIDFGGVIPTGDGLINTQTIPQFLPIELITFKAYKSENNITIYWQTASEENNDYFTIERSFNGTYYETIGTVSGAGNSSSEIDYLYTDDNPLNGVAYYRLTQTDYNGKSETFDAVSLSYLNEDLFSVGPNPATDNLTIALGGEMGNANILFYDIIGALVKNISMQSPVKTIDVSDLSSGTYMVIIAADQNMISKRIVIQ